MIKVKPLEQVTRKYVKNSIIAYLDDESGCDEKWIMGVLKKSGLDLEEIKSMVNSLREYGDSGRYKFLSEFVELK